MIDVTEDFGHKSDLLVDWKSGIDPKYFGKVVRFLS